MKESISTQPTGIHCMVNGRPQQRGSKSPHVVRQGGGAVLMKNGRPVIATRDSNVKSGPWMAAVRFEAAEVYNERPLLRGPVELSVIFYFARPKSHYGSGRNAGRLKPSAPLYHTQMPDLSKLIRTIEDALTGVIYKDDAQISRYGETGKDWTESSERACITVKPLDCEVLHTPHLDERNAL